MVYKTIRVVLVVHQYVEFVRLLILQFQLAIVVQMNLHHFDFVNLYHVEVELVVQAKQDHLNQTIPVTSISKHTILGSGTNGLPRYPK